MLIIDFTDANSILLCYGVRVAILSRENSMLKTEKSELEENLSSVQGKM